MAYGRVDGTSALKPEDDNAYGDSDFYGKSTKPNLTVLEGGKSKKAAKATEASKGLGDAEKGAAANPIAKTGDGAKNILNAEAGGLAAGGFINNVRGLKATEKKGVKGKLKKGGPVGAIIALFLGIGGLMLGGQSLMPFSLVAQFIGNFDSMAVSTSLRSRVFLRYQTNGDVKELRKTGIFGGKKFKITNKQAAKLKAEGIDEAEVDVNGKKKTVLVLDDGSAKRTIITPDGKNLDEFQGLTSVTTKSGETVEVGRAMVFEDALQKIPDFFHGYSKATATWRKSIGAWFGEVTVHFLDKVDTSRNHFKNFRKRVEDYQNGNTRSGQAEQLDTPTTTQEAEMEVAKADMNKGADEVSMNVRTGQATTEQQEDGSTKTNIDEKGNEKATFKTGLSDEEIKVRTQKIAKAEAIANGAQATANVICAVAGVAGTVSILAAAAEALQIMKLISSFTEAIQKVQAGEGADSPIHVLSQSLVTGDNTRGWELTDDGIVDNDEDYAYNSYDIEQKTLRTNVSAMQSAGIAALYGNTPVDQNDPSVQSFNITASVDSILTKLGAGAGSFMVCTMAKLATALASGVATLATLFFGGGLAKVLENIAGRAAFAIGVSVSIAYALKFLVPKLADSLTRDLISQLAGEDLGNALVSGANMYMGGNHRYGGGSLTDKDGLLAYTIEQEKVIADNAKYERATRSPFDATSQYTFLGTLLTKFASFYTASYSASGILTTIGNITKNSISSILPSASAVTATKMIEGTGNCPYLESIGAVGDAYCNPHIITDVSSKTMEEHPADIVQKLADEDMLEFPDGDEGDRVKIVEDSDLGRFVLYCSERSSSFGFADQNISNDFQVGTVDTGITGIDAVINGAVGIIPIAGDALDVVQNTNVARNIGWITGESCVAGNTSGGTDYGDGITSATPSWANEGEYFQRFLEDQRLMETIDPDYTSAEVAFLEEYYAKHPLDNSYEGILARYSGLTKETVVATLDAIDYLNYIADYDPSTRYVFGDDDTDYIKKTYIDTGNNIAADSENIILQYVIVYNDIRNRTATV